MMMMINNVNVSNISNCCVQPVAVRESNCWFVFKPPSVYATDVQLNVTSNVSSLQLYAPKPGKG